MVILLPREISGIDVLEKQLTASLVEKTIKAMGNREVEVFLPKFKFDASYGLVPALQSIGMLPAFTNDAEFACMSDLPQGLKIDDVIHKTTIEVDEEGTVATAATAIRMLPSCSPFSERQWPPVFLVDHPFIFLIRDTRTGAIIFLGKFARPKQGAAGSIPSGPSRSLVDLLR